MADEPKISVDFSKPMRELDGRAMIEMIGIAELKTALLTAGVQPHILDQAFAAIAPFVGDLPQVAVVLTAGRAVANALQRPEEEKKLPGADAVKRIALAIKAMGDEQPVSLAAEEAKMIRTAIRKSYDAPLIYFRIDEMLEGREPATVRPAGIKAEPKA